MFKSIKKNIGQFIKKRPLISFSISLMVLAGAIVLSYILRTPTPVEETKTEVIRQVQVQSQGDHYLTVQGQVQKEGVVNVIAQTSGVVQKVNVKPGDTVKAKTQLAAFSTNYNGANSAAIQAQQANLAYKNNKENYVLQKEMIGLQRQQAEGQFESAQKAWQFTADIKDKTEESLKISINLSNSALDKLNDQLKYLYENNQNNSHEMLINAALATKSATLAQLSESEKALKNIEYQTNEDNFPFEAAGVAQELAKKNLEVQERALDLQLENSRLASALAQVQASLMRPVTPIAGTVQVVNIKAGDMVSPGQVIAIVNNDQSSAYIDVAIAKETAQSLNMDSSVKVDINGQTFSIAPTYVSTIPVSGAAYNLRLDLPAEIASLVDHRTNLTLQLPLHSSNAKSDQPIVPIDAIYQTQQESYIYVVGQDENGQPVAQLKTITLGKAIGGSVEVTGGLELNDQVILNRQVRQGDRIEILEQ